MFHAAAMNKRKAVNKPKAITDNVGMSLEIPKSKYFMLQFFTCS